MREIVFHNDPIDLSERLSPPDFALMPETQPVLARTFSQEDAVQAVKKLSHEYIQRKHPSVDSSVPRTDSSSELVLR
jgi:hypothetical protein